jgi:hypothetical protein
MHSPHEGYAVIKEELDELWDEIKKKPAKRDNLRMWNELLQISAMAQRLAEDCIFPNPLDVIRYRVAEQFLETPAKVNTHAVAKDFIKTMGFKKKHTKKGKK